MNLHSFSFAAMGSPCTLHLHAPTALDASRAADAAEAEIARLEARYSRYRPTSELARINAAARAATPVTLDEEASALLDHAFACHRKSSGLFDITSGILRRAWNFSSPRLPAQSEIDSLLPFIGMDKLDWRPPVLAFTLPGIELDLGGIVKEYAADRAAEVCASRGLAHGIVELGGDVRLLGPHPSGDPWPVGIAHPRRPDSALATVPLASGALATSGDYQRFFDLDGRRYCHLLNPKTGWPVDGLSTVSVAAPSCLLAGSVSTIAMLMGRDSIPWLASLSLPHLWVDSAGSCGGPLAP